FDDEGSGGEQLQQGLTLLRHRRGIRLTQSRIAAGAGHRENGDLLHRLARALRGEGETPDRVELITPPLKACRGRHPEAVYVDDSAANTEFGDFGHRGNSSVTHRFQRGGCFRERTAAG